MKALSTMMKRYKLSSILGLLMLMDSTMRKGAMGLHVRSPLAQFHTAEMNQQWRIRGIVHQQQLLSNKNIEKLQHRRQNAKGITSLYLFRKIAENLQSIEAEYNCEVEQASLSPLDVFTAEGKKSSDIPKAYGLMKERMAAMAGDTETKLQLLEPRSYANGELLDADHVAVAPNLSDLDQPPSAKKMDRLWISPPFRMSVVVGAYLIFPFLQKLCNGIITVESSEDFNMVTSQFAPGIGVLYGTIVALTLDILYDRESRIQENVTLEAGLLSQITQHLLSLFESSKETDLARETSQLVAEQVRMLGTRTRGAELLSIMRADPYAQILGIVDEYHLEKGYDFTPHQNSLTECLRSEIPQIMEARAKRLSDEASSLPPTHFLVLTILTALILIGYTVATLTLVEDNGAPSQESQVVFAGLSAVYVLFYNFCKDLNSPFDGVYQIKRSSAASYLLQVKWLISNQAYGKDIVFDDVHPVFKEEGYQMLQQDVSVFGEAVIPRDDLLKQKEQERKPKISSPSSSSNDFSSTRKRRRRGREMRARLERGARNLATDILSSVQFVDESPTAASAAGERYRQKRKEVLQRRRQTRKLADEVEGRVREARLLAKQKKEEQLKEKKERDRKLAKKLIERGEKPLTASFVKSVAWAEDGEYTPPPKQRKIEKKVSTGSAGASVPTKNESQQQKVAGKAGDLKSGFKVAWDDPSPAQRRQMAAMRKEGTARDSDIKETELLPLKQEDLFEEPAILVPYEDDTWSDVSVCTTPLSTAETILRTTTASSPKASPAADYFRSKGGSTSPAQPAQLFQVALASLDTMNAGLMETKEKTKDLKNEEESDAVAYFRSVGGGVTSPTLAQTRKATPSSSKIKDRSTSTFVEVADESNTVNQKINKHVEKVSTSKPGTEKENSPTSLANEIESTGSIATENVSLAKDYKTEKEPLYEASHHKENVIIQSPSEDIAPSSLVDHANGSETSNGNTFNAENTSTTTASEHTDGMEVSFDFHPRGNDSKISSSSIPTKENEQEERSAVVQYFHSVAGSNGMSDTTDIKDAENAASTANAMDGILPDKINGEKDTEQLALKYFRTVSGKEMAPVAPATAKPSTSSSWGTPVLNGVKADDTITVTTFSPMSPKTTTVQTSNKQQKKEQRVLTRRNAVSSDKNDIINYFRQSGGFGFGGNN